MTLINEVIDFWSVNYAAFQYTDGGHQYYLFFSRALVGPSLKVMLHMDITSLEESVYLDLSTSYVRKKSSTF